MNIDDAKNSRQLAHLYQFIDNHASDALFFRLANEKNTPEELAKTFQYFDMTKKVRAARMFTINDIIRVMNKIQ